MASDYGVGDETPVGDYNAFEAKLSTEKVGNDALVHTRSNFLILSANWTGIVRHDLACASSNGSLEGDEVVLEVVARVCGVLAICEVAVLSVLDRSAAREVLGDCCDRLVAKLVARKTFNVSDDKLSCELCVFAHGSSNPGPTRLSSEINLRVQRRSKTNC